MLPTEFLLIDLRFALSVMAALATFATAWLYLDAWLGRRDLKDALKWAGFGLLSGGFLLAGAQVQSDLGGGLVLGQLTYAGEVLRLLGYVLVAAGVALDPLQAKPKAPGLHESKLAAGGVAGLPLGVAVSALLASAVAAGLYWRRATIGLERHLRAVAWSMTAFVVYEALGVVVSRAYSDPRLEQWLGEFGTLWVVQQLALVVAVFCLLRWVWGYLTKRVQTQLFIVMACGGLGVFLVTTLSFTFLLMSRVQQETLAQMATTAKVLDTAVSSRKTEISAQAKTLAADSALVTAVQAGSLAALEARLAGEMVTNGWSGLVVTDADGRVLWRGQDPASKGDSLSGDQTVALALIGRATAGLVSSKSGFEPSLAMSATWPVRGANGSVRGSVQVLSVLDNAFVDGLRSRTGLEAAVYSQNVLVAATAEAAGGAGRQIGLKLTNTQVTHEVLRSSRLWQGTQSVGGRRYLAVYAPLKDAQNQVVGMLFVGQSQAQLLETVGYSIELTFVVTIVLLIVGIWPTHLISRALARQLR